jgi:hypothetical protein
VDRLKKMEDPTRASGHGMGADSAKWMADVKEPNKGVQWLGFDNQITTTAPCGPQNPPFATQSSNIAYIIISLPVQYWVDLSKIIGNYL